MFTTKDFTLACTLLSLGYRALEWTRDRLGNLIFHFSRDEHLDAYVEGFWRGEVRIEPKAFQHAQKYLRSLIRNDQATA